MFRSRTSTYVAPRNPELAARNLRRHQRPDLANRQVVGPRHGIHLVVGIGWADVRVDQAPGVGDKVVGGHDPLRLEPGGLGDDELLESLGPRPPLLGPRYHHPGGGPGTTHGALGTLTADHGSVGTPLEPLRALVGPVLLDERGADNRFAVGHQRTLGLVLEKDHGDARAGERVGQPEYDQESQ